MQLLQIWMYIFQLVAELRGKSGCPVGQGGLSCRVLPSPEPGVMNSKLTPACPSREHQREIPWIPAAPAAGFCYEYGFPDPNRFCRARRVP